MSRLLAVKGPNCERATVAPTLILTKRLDSLSCLFPAKKKISNGYFKIAVPHRMMFRRNKRMEKAVRQSQMSDGSFLEIPALPTAASWETLAAIGKPCGATISGQMYPSQPLRLLSHVFFTKSSPCILIHGELFINQSCSNAIYDAAVSHRTVMRAEPPTVQENSVSGHSPAVIFSISVGCSNSVPAT